MHYGCARPPDQCNTVGRSSSREDLVQPVVDDRIRQWQVAELAMSVRPFGRREDAPRHRAAYAFAEALGLART